MAVDLAVPSFDPECHLGSGCGFPAPGADIFFFDPVWTFTILGIEFNITKQIILLVLVGAAVVGFFWYAFRRPALVPRGAQNVGEMGYLFIRDGIARDTIGKAGDRFVPLLFTAFFLVWPLNFLGILPFAQIPVTATFAIPVAFALVIYFTWVPLGIKRQGVGGFFKAMTMPPDVPKAMYVLLIPIEFVSNFLVRPFTHCVRLFANMFAGHLLIATFSVGAFYLLSASVLGIIGSTASFVVAVGMTAFEVLIQFLQAYVFTMLAAVYLNDAVHGH
ncbi:MAG: F0F1 ATP synthase subunit A [Actinomycetia bacterium]|nr:F0F1 ATP synthase subunit A [Actinomycetes bacterium]